MFSRRSSSYAERPSPCYKHQNTTQNSKHSPSVWKQLIKIMCSGFKTYIFITVFRIFFILYPLLLKLFSCFYVCFLSTQDVFIHFFKKQQQANKAASLIHSNLRPVSSSWDSPQLCLGSTGGVSVPAGFCERTVEPLESGSVRHIQLTTNQRT